MIFVSEKPIFAIDFSPIPIGSTVYIIEKQYVKFNTCTFGEEVMERDEDRFKKGTLLACADDEKYTVLLANNNEMITFRESLREYFFRKKEI